jgi:uncharacterized protein YcnI
MKKLLFGSAAIIGLVAVVEPVRAHVALEHDTAQADAPFMAAFHVGHGCSGSPTVRLRIKIPPGVVAVEPQPKAGWSVITETGPYASGLTSGGQTFVEGVKDVIWSGLLPAHKTTTFTIKTKLAADAKPGQKLVFPVLQECEKGVERWIDLDDEDDHPAPYVTIEPKKR